MDGMTSHPSTAAPILAALAIVLVTLAVYTAGYFGLGQRMDSPYNNPRRVERSYSQRWLVTIFRPAAWIEQKVRGCDVYVTCGPMIQQP
jgi:hypothetical protein